MLRYLTAGESHGQKLVAIIEGLPSGLGLTASFINTELERRQKGFGRGGRQLIEKDVVSVVSGIRAGMTTGAPLALEISNLDWENWKDVMSCFDPCAAGLRTVTRPRPGHADLSGALKYNEQDMRNILERSSARETAARVAVGAVAKAFLLEFGISVFSWVTNIGAVRADMTDDKNPEGLFKRAEGSLLRCPDPCAEAKMIRLIEKAKKEGDSLGGIFEVVALDVPPGLGSHVQWDRKLDGRLAMALMSVQAIKGVEMGMGFAVAKTPGSKVHDEIFYTAKKTRGSHFFRKTNNAGGIEGGMTNGEPVVIRAAMKPIPTLYKPLRSVDIASKKPFKATVERSDICAVPSASVVGEAVVGIELVSAFLEKFGGDSMTEISRNYAGYLVQIGSF
ncbi:MAG: chorismate synthase [Deltaproteobacteria bacterium]|nr:chorismate synthase [Deltaproteobacteria bacterium]